MLGRRIAWLRGSGGCRTVISSVICSTRTSVMMVRRVSGVQTVGGFSLLCRSGGVFRTRGLWTGLMVS